MARIAKSGLEYFPFDIDFFQDIRIRKLIKRQGGKAVTVYALLLCLIYKNGYYMQWDDELPFIGSELSGYDEAYVSEVIKACLSLGLFDKDLYDNERVLTSKGIQVRYCNIQRLNKRMSRIDKYSLVEVDSQKPNTTKSKPKKQKPAKPVVAAKTPSTPQTVEDDTNKKRLSVFFSDNHSENLKLLCKNFGLEPNDTKQLRVLAEAVVAEWELSATEHSNYSDWSRHLISSMRIKNRDNASSKPKSNNKPSAPSDNDYTFGGGFGGKDQ